MGWTSYNATEYKDNGKIDRVAEINKTFTGDNENGTWKPLKSVAVGSTVYTACEHLDKKTGKKIVFAAITLTRIDSKDYYNFSYKDMEESMGCVENKCPNSILKLLSSLEDIYDVNSNSYTWAKEWREQCTAYNERSKNSNLSKLPVGAEIEMNYWKENQSTRKLHKANYYGKAIWTDGYFKYSTRLINKRGYKIL